MHSTKKNKILTIEDNGDGMTREPYVQGASLRDDEARRRIHRVPEAKVLDRDTKPVEPRGEVACEKRTARETEKEDARRWCAGGRRRDLRLVPAARTGEDHAPADAGRLSEDKRADVRARPGLKMPPLRIVFDTRLVDERNVRLLAANALPRSLEEQREIHILPFEAACPFAQPMICLTRVESLSSTPRPAPSGCAHAPVACKNPDS